MLPEKLANRLFQRTPGPLRRYVQRLWYLPADLRDRLVGPRDRLLPPRGRRFDGAEAFEQVGQSMLGYFRQLAGLKRHDRVLDLGCGIGRIAIPLTEYLEPPGSYVGLDINRADIRWCQRHITPRFPGFEFLHADVHSDEYHRSGSHHAESYELPFADSSIDFVCAISLFTHLTEAAALNYVRQIARVLKPGGRCFLTFFLLDAESRQAIDEGRTELVFNYRQGASWAHDPDNPEAAIAFERQAVISVLESLGLNVPEPIPGFWADRAEAPSYQDMVVATKATPAL